MKSAALEAANSSTRGSGRAPGGPAFSWECRAAQSHQARPEEAQEPSWGTAKAGALTMLSYRHWSTYGPGRSVAGMRTLSTISRLGSSGPPLLWPEHLHACAPGAPPPWTW